MIPGRTGFPAEWCHRCDASATRFYPSHKVGQEVMEQLSEVNQLNISLSVSVDSSPLWCTTIDKLTPVSRAVTRPSLSTSC